MITDAKSRRQFLIGAGRLSLALQIPLLPSILPRRAEAQVAKPPLRFLQCLLTWSEFDATWLPPRPNLQVLDAANNVKGIKLADIPGPISKVIGPAFDPLRNKLTLVRGLHVLAASNLHNKSKPNCASGCSRGDDSVPVFRCSIEHVLSSSRVVYPSTSGIQRFVGVARPYDRNPVHQSFAWTPAGSKMSSITDPRALFSRLMGSFQPTTVDPLADARTKRQVDVMHEVYQDYKALVTGGRLSTEDRQRLEQYAALIAEIRTDLAKPRQSCGTAPTLSGSTDPEAVDADMVKMVAAIFACRLSNVVDFVIVPHSTPSTHDLQHGGDRGGRYSDMTAQYGRLYASLWSTLDGMKDTDGKTVLDNTLAFWGHSEGNTVHGQQHMPTLVAGSAGGRLNTGYFLDFGARPYNNFLVTILAAAGIQPAEYESYVGQVGFGEYNAAMISRYGVGAFTSDAEKRKPLPFLFRG